MRPTGRFGFRFGFRFFGVSTYTDNLMRMVEEHLDALQVVTEATEGDNENKD